MKNIFLFFAIILFYSCNAQTRFPQRIISQTQAHNGEEILSGDYVKDTENKLNTYEGTWIYNANGIEFILKLEKKEQVLSDFGGHYYFYDMIITRYKLVKNNVTLFDNLDATLPHHILSRNEEGVFGFFNFAENYSKLSGGFYDFNYNIISNCFLTKIITSVGEPERIIFKLWGGIKYNEPGFYEGLTDAFSIPNNIELTKL